VSATIRRRRGGEDPGVTGTRGGGERGSGTVLVVGVVAALAVLMVGGLLVAAAARAAQHAATAADLAAIGGAQAQVLGDSDACAAAGATARANGARLLGCAIHDDDSVQVSVTVPVHLLWGLGSSDATATARAGPLVEPESSPP